MNRIFLFCIFLSVIILSSCTRYSYIPRQHNFFVSKSEKKELIKTNDTLEKVNSFVVSDEKTNEEMDAIGADQQEFDLTSASKENEGPVIKKSIINELNSNLFEKNNLIKIHNTISHPISKKVYKKLVKKNPIFKKQKHLKEDEPQVESKFSMVSFISFLMGVLAILLLVFTFVSEFFLNLYIYSEIALVASIFLAISAIVLGIIALSVTKKDKGKYNNRLMAAIGLILGGLVFLALIVLIVGLLLVFGL